MTTPTARVLTAARLIDGTGAPVREHAAIVVEAGRIVRVGSAGDALPAGEHVERLDLGDATLLPGLINCHVHLCLPGDGTPFETWLESSDEVLLLTAAENARRSLLAGVTTLRECGGKARLLFGLRAAIRQGILPGPTLMLSGHPLTITGGHCHPFGGEVEGVDAIRTAARKLLKQGADFIKIMASGGGTLGTYPHIPAYSTDELRAAAETAHGAAKRCAAHCIAIESIHRALDAGVDGIEHASCYAPDLTVQYDPRAGERLAATGTFVTPTLQVGRDAYEGIAALPDPTPAQRAYLAAAPERLQCGQDVIRRYHELGVRFVAGNDAGWRFTRFETFWGELREFTAVGVPALAAIYCATGRAAELLQLEGDRGTLRPGLAADIIAVPGDPTADLARLAQPLLVLKDGHRVV